MMRSCQGSRATEPTLAAARAALGEAAFRAAWDAGQGLAAEDALDAALATTA
ncbi:MAG TPA: hypothetical protein VMU89_20190 [Thermomicrobiaceae bacterium]|nr:hypothetical protein [Thermomicrobiaceae bacterium]